MAEEAAPADETNLRIGVLGPLLGTRGGIEFTAPHGRAGVLLAVLAMSAGQPVSCRRLAQVIWSDEPPVSVRASLHSLVARVRGLVPGAIVTVGDGYLLDIDPDHVDLMRFRRLVRAADEARDPAAARQLLDEALRLWRGEPLSGLRSAALERTLVPGLTDEHLSAVQKRADLELAAGGNDRVIAEMRGLTGRYPLREPLWVQLLRALASAGRPAEAIQEYHHARETLAAELGVDPSPELQDLYSQLLQTDWRGAAPGRSVISQSGPSRSTPEELLADEPIAAGPEPVHTEWVPSVPRQLPAGAAGFAGRAVLLRFLSELAEEAMADPSGVMMSAISGMTGVGKRACAALGGLRGEKRQPKPSQR
jgi:DNA-binding SARP family transcriptional activator